MSKRTSKTANGDLAYEHSMNHALEFFSKGGSIRSGKTYYANIASDVVKLFKDAWYADNTVAMKLLFWCRDARGGAGNRQVFRDCIKWLADTDSEWVKANVSLIPVYGRWDDLASLYGTECEEAALDLWAGALMSNDDDVTPLAAKWADRQDAKLRGHMSLSPKQFRKLVVNRTGFTVERAMCQGKWEEIDFGKIPSVAGARYRKAFKKHQEARYNEWCLSLATTKKVNASVLFPHDLVRLVHSTPDRDKAFETLAGTMFENLPNYISDPSVKIMPICDFSGSMSTKVSGSVSALDVSLALGLYCSDRIGKDNPFYRKLIPFSNDSKLVSWKNMTFLKAVTSDDINDGWCGSTNIEGALNKLLEGAEMWNVKPEDMITTLLILSDMQWNQGVRTSDAVIEKCMQRWEEAGYKRPRIVYWCLVAYNNQPETKNGKNCALVSGFSPSILKYVLGQEEINPIKTMMDAIAKYEIVTP
jgi:hypothetical protein